MHHRVTSVVKITSLKLPGGWDKHLDQAVLDGLVDELERGSALPPIGVTPDRRVLYGLHCVAAHKLTKRSAIRADVIECTDDEAASLALAENARRRSLSDAEIAEAVAALAPRPKGSFAPDAASKPATPTNVGRGASKAAALLAVAKAAGISESTVKRAIKRAEAAQDAPGEAEEPKVDPRADYDAKRAALGRVLSEAAAQLSAALGKLTTAEPDHGWSGVQWQRLRGMVRAAGGEIRASMPAGDCGYCDVAKEGYGVADCPACQGSGYLTASQLANLPREARE